MRDITTLVANIVAPDRRKPQTHVQQAASPQRRIYDHLARFSDEQRHAHALQAIRLRSGRVAPLPACFRGERDA